MVNELGEIDLLNLFSVQHPKLKNEAHLKCTPKPYKCFFQVSSKHFALLPFQLSFKFANN